MEKISKECEKYLQYATPNKRIKSIRCEITGPFGRVHIDIIGPLPETERGNKYIIAAVDAMTRWPEAIPVNKKTAHEVSQFIIRDIFARHDAPQQLVSDQGKEFLNSVVAHLCQIMGAYKTNTLIQSPMQRDGEMNQ